MISTVYSGLVIDDVHLSVDILCKLKSLAEVFDKVFKVYKWLVTSLILATFSWDAPNMNFKLLSNFTLTQSYKYTL